MKTRKQPLASVSVWIAQPEDVMAAQRIARPGSGRGAAWGSGGRRRRGVGLNSGRGPV